MSAERDRILSAYQQALDSSSPAVIPLGRNVFCDSCDEDMTDDPRSGGFLFGSYAYGPCCADKRLRSIRSYGEENHIRGRCPEGVSFADWVRSMRTGPGGNEIRVTPGRPA